jgi:hypothetical protein
VRPYGAGAVRAETADGKVILLRLDWTELGLGCVPLELDGRSVRFAPEALRELVRWVDKRLKATGGQSGSCKKVGHGQRLDISSDHGRGLSGVGGAAGRLGAADRSAGAQATAGVVEQAGAPAVDGGSPKPRGGVR